jgi:carboxyl-terminal processing protease
MSGKWSVAQRHLQCQICLLLSLFLLSLPNHALSENITSSPDEQKKEGDAEQSPTTEFIRALDLIEQTQLELFIYSEPATTDDVLLELDRRLNSPEYPERVVHGTTREVAIMRELLSETIDRYEDRYANYISPRQLVAYGERRSGSYVGVGLKFRSVTDDYPLVIGALLGGPLANSDIKPGDRLVAVDGDGVKGYSTSKIRNRLKGAPNTEFELSIRRNNKLHTVKSTRRAVDLHYARAERLANNIGYIRITRFGGKTHNRVEALLKNLIADGISSVVLDLRDNPGGSTRAARAVVSMFSKSPHVYCEKYKSGKDRQLPRHGPHLTDLPLAILVNGDSKSSAEIVAGALQGQQRALIVGSPTFGKGLVQRVFNLAEPLGGALRTTIAMFGTQSHGLIHGNGIVPDYFLETEADFMFREGGSLNISSEARDYQRELLERHVRKKYRDSDADKADRLIDAKDEQLQLAIDLLSESRLDASEDN